MNMQSVKTNPEDLTVVFHKEHGGCHGPVCKIMHDVPGTMYQNNCVSYIIIQVYYYYNSPYYIGDFSIPEIDDTTIEDEEEQEELGENFLVARCPQIQSPKHTAGRHEIAAFILGITYTYTYMPI